MCWPVRQWMLGSRNHRPWCGHVRTIICENRNCMKYASREKIARKKYICSGWEYVGEMEHVVLFMDTHHAQTPAVEDWVAWEWMTSEVVVGHSTVALQCHHLQREEEIANHHHRLISGCLLGHHSSRHIEATRLCRVAGTWQLGRSLESAASVGVVGFAHGQPLLHALHSTLIGGQPCYSSSTMSVHVARIIPCSPLKLGMHRWVSFPVECMLLPQQHNTYIF